MAVVLPAERDIEALCHRGRRVALRPPEGAGDRRAGRWVPGVPAAGGLRRGSDGADPGRAGPRHRADASARCRRDGLRGRRVAQGARDDRRCRRHRGSACARGGLRGRAPRRVVRAPREDTALRAAQAAPGAARQGLSLSRDGRDRGRVQPQAGEDIHRLRRILREGSRPRRDEPPQVPAAGDIHERLHLLRLGGGDRVRRVCGAAGALRGAALRRVQGRVRFVRRARAPAGAWASCRSQACRCRSFLPAARFW